jgi:hypothetical protein
VFSCFRKVLTLRESHYSPDDLSGALVDLVRAPVQIGSGILLCFLHHDDPLVGGAVAQGRRRSVQRPVKGAAAATLGFVVE